MNILFVAPPLEKKELPSTYKAIIETCRKLKHTVFKDHLLNKAQKKSTNVATQMEQRYKKIVSYIKESDLVIAEGTTITAEMSRLISIALQQHKHTLILYKKNNPDVYVFESSRLLTLKQYTPTNLVSTLDSYLKQSNKKKLLYRFNLMLSKEIDMYVMDKARTHKISKADYIRKLITNDMDQIAS